MDFFAAYIVQTFSNNYMLGRKRFPSGHEQRAFLQTFVKCLAQIIAVQVYGLELYFPRVHRSCVPSHGKGNLRAGVVKSGLDILFPAKFSETP